MRNLHIIYVVHSESWYFCRITTTENRAFHMGISQCWYNIAIDSSHITTTIKIMLNCAISQGVCDSTRDSGSKLCPLNECSRYTVWIKSVGRVEYLKFEHVMVAFVCIVLLVLTWNCVQRVKFGEFVCTSQPIRRPINIIIKFLLAIETSAAITTAKILTKYRVFGCCCNSLSGAAIRFRHLAYHWSSTENVIDNTVIDCNINIACYRFSTIHATPIKFIYDSMVNLECDIAIHLFIASSCQCTKSTSINITMWVVCIDC